PGTIAGNEQWLPQQKTGGSRNPDGEELENAMAHDELHQVTEQPLVREMAGEGADREPVEREQNKGPDAEKHAPGEACNRHADVVVNDERSDHGPPRRLD